MREEMLGFVRTFAGRAPLYARLAAGFADQPAVLEILAEAPEPQRLPVTLFAAIHDLLLADPSDRLAQWYPNLSPNPRTDDPVPEAVAFCTRHRLALLDLVRSRTPQTNEIGRSALLLVGLARVFSEVGPLAQLDVGASAGLNLLIDRYGYDYSGHRVGTGAPVLHCAVRGPGRAGRLPAQLPAIGSRLGLDRRPIDLADTEQVRWLEACTWADQADRFERLRAAIGVAREAAVKVVPGDAVADLVGALDSLGPGHRVVTTSWVLSYLGPQGQGEFVTELDRLGARADLSWVSLEEPALTGGLDWPAAVEGATLSMLRVVTWRGGVRTDEVLAECHPHGYWLRWR